jgi:hypothetical protein
MSNPTIIRVPGEPGPRGPRGFPFLIKGTLNDPSELSGAYLVFDGEDEVIFEGLQPGDVGYEEPVIASAYLIDENIWVFDDQEVWINAGAIRATATIDSVNVVDPDQNPDVFNIGTGADAVFVFDLPRAPGFTVGSVVAGNDAQDADIVNVGQDGDIELDFTLPVVPVSVGDTNTVNPDQNPSVTNAGTAEDVILEFDIPRAASVTLGQTTVVNPDENPSVSITTTDGDVEIDFDLPRAAQFSVDPANIVNPDQDPAVALAENDGDYTVTFDIPRAPDVTIGTTNVVNPDQNPSVSSTITDGDLEIDFDLPRAATVSVGTVTTVEDTDPATVTDVGQDGDVVLDFEIPSGKVGIDFRGEWSAQESYDVRDVVTFRDSSDDNASAYIALQDSTNQQPPAAGNAPSAFWDILAKGGSDGAGAPSTSIAPAITRATQTGVTGVSEQFARADHAHPSEGFFADDGSIGDLVDVNLYPDGESETIEDGSILIFDGEDSQWVPFLPPEQIFTLEGLSDTNIPDPEQGFALIYDGDVWVAASVAVDSIDGGNPSSVYN